ncbi:MAG: Holliday junction branch migration DNA helicase RuvB [Phycisphaeraceae bacterium]|nr:Holliday junction branch migration DNA helicase RuvB [Phycisphaerae bacterium]MBX3391824.1 Holliday junction branch migration DNA helicase RuvB [Phycisphaeraceae bacterium]HRJ49599.1 Holliday junction branch migration DNA helicase RuvB [Phycisphaerales bacterium]
MATERLLSPQPGTPDEDEANYALRPGRMEEYIGQRDLVERVSIAVAAARSRSDPMEHVLLHGPPGLGKTTLAHVIAREMNSRITVTSGPALARGTDLVSALQRLGHGDVLFIDEIHRLPVAVEEFVYPAMEDFRIDVTVDSGLNARTIQLRCKPFTLIGATTRAGLLSSPLRSRFGQTFHLQYYTVAELATILRRSCSLLNVRDADEPALLRIAERSRGTPRIANRLLRRVRDFSHVRAGNTFTPAVVDDALALEGVDPLGLDELDRSYLRTIGNVYACGPVGLETVAATMNEDAGTLEDVVEPYLLQIGFLARTRRGRALTRAACEHLGIPFKTSDSDESSLF